MFHIYKDDKLIKTIKNIERKRTFHELFRNTIKTLFGVDRYDKDQYSIHEYDILKHEIHRLLDQFNIDEDTFVIDSNGSKLFMTDDKYIVRNIQNKVTYRI